MHATAIEKNELGIKERIFSLLMLSSNDWIIRTHNKILDFKNGTIANIIEINDYGDIIDTAWGGSYALSYKHNHILLIGRDTLFAWNRSDYNFKVSKISNQLKAHANFPNSVLRPFRASIDSTERISILLEIQVSGHSPFWADLEVKDDLTSRWITDQPKHLYAGDYPMEAWQEINKTTDLPDISDISSINNKLLVFTTGFHTAYGKYDMHYCILTTVDENGNSNGKQVSFESSFGFFSSDKKWLIIKPLYRKGDTKGKTFLLNLETYVKTALNLPRGLSKYRILDIYENTILLSNDNFGKYPAYHLPDKESLVLVEVNTN
jgi:hypothetical protein